MVSTLFRLYNLSDGEIQMSNLNISTISLHYLRKNISIVPQEHILFSGILRFNLVSLKKKLDIRNIKLDSISYSFSMGEKQLLYIAKGILSPSKVIVFDEANIDKNMSNLIKNLIKKFEKKTIIIVAHRLDIISEICQKVLVLKKGKIEEFDDVSKLKQDSNSKFFNLLKFENN